MIDDAIDFETYSALMTSAGFSKEEIEDCWLSVQRYSILLAFINQN